MKPRATIWVAAAAVLSLVSPGAWGAWQGAGARNASLAAASLGYSLSGSNVTGGGTGYSWVLTLGLLGSSTNHFAVTNTGTVAETIEATVSTGGVNLGSLTVYACAVPFSGLNCASGAATLRSGAGDIALTTNLVAGGTRYIAVHISTVAALTVTTTIAANTFTITPKSLGPNRTTG